MRAAAILASTQPASSPAHHRRRLRRDVCRPADIVWGNQLFKGAEIIAHRSVPEQMKHVADPDESRKLLHGVEHVIPRTALKLIHPGIVAAGQLLLEDYDFDSIELVMPTTLFDTRYEFDLDGLDGHLICVGPCHQVGDTIVHVPKEGVVSQAMSCPRNARRWAGPEPTRSGSRLSIC